MDREKDRHIGILRDRQTTRERKADRQMNQETNINVK